VVAAYDRLLAQGLVEARPQRGFYVRDDRPAAAPAPATGLPRPVDATALIRGMFHRGPSLPAPGMGTLPPEWLDLPLLRSALRRATAGDASAVQYGEPAGDSGLREMLAARLADIGVPVHAGQIVTTCGATHALDLVSRALLSQGDAVLVDEPGWAVEYARLTRMGMRLLPVPRGPMGPDLDAMRQLASAHRPKLYVTVSALHNPTGCSLTPAAAHQVLVLAAQHDFHIVEDDTYTHFAPPQVPRLSALDGLRRTVYVSGFSKILTPNWRVGYLAAAPDMVERCIDLKLLTTLTTPTVTEKALAICLQKGPLRRHLERVNGLLDAARVRSQRLALDAGCRFVTPPQGLFGWLDVGVDTDRLAQAMLDDGWLLAPGSLFHASPRPTTLMRINFATSQEAKFWESLVATRHKL
jgi:DNA-binding transcriptional MocR family regulator